MPRSRDEIQTLVTRALMETAPDIPINDLDLSCIFRERYEIDSIDLTNFFVRLEKHLDIAIPIEMLTSLNTLNKVIEYLISRGV